MPNPIRGDLDTFSLPDLFQWLEVSRQSGRLTLTHGRTRRSLDLQAGRIVFVSSTRPEELLGAYLVRSGILTSAAAYASLAENLMTGQTLTRTVLNGGLATRDCLAWAVEGLAVEILLDCFRWKGAAFEFDPGVLTEDLLQIRLSLHGQTLAIRGAKAVDELPEPAAGTADEPTGPFAWDKVFDPAAVADTFWTIVDRTPPSSMAPMALRGLFSDFQGFLSELRRRLSGPLRFAPIYDDTAVLLRRALAQDSSDEQLIQVFALDPFLTLNLVSLANTLLSQSEAIATPRSAAEVIGPAVFRFFLDLSSRRDAPRTSSADPLERVLRASSISTAVAASRVAHRLGRDQEEAYTGGLLGPLAAYDPLQALLAVGFEPGKFRAGVLHEYRPLCGSLLAQRWGLPEGLAALLGSDGTVTASSSEAMKMVYHANQLVPPEGIGSEFSSEEPELVKLSASLSSDAELLLEIRRHTESLFEIIGLP